MTTGVGAFLAQRVLTGFGGKENLMLAVVIGVVGTTVVSRIPAIGPLLLGAMMVFGAGAAVLGVADWRRDRREAAAAQAAANAAAAGVVAATAAPASVITPIVQTSPAPASMPAADPAPAAAAGTVTGVTAVAEARMLVTEPVQAPEAPTAPAEPAPAPPTEPAPDVPTVPAADQPPAASDAGAPQEGEQPGPTAT